MSTAPKYTEVRQGDKKAACSVVKNTTKAHQGTTTAVQSMAGTVLYLVYLRWPEVRFQPTKENCTRTVFLFCMFPAHGENCPAMD